MRKAITFKRTLADLQQLIAPENVAILYDLGRAAALDQVAAEDFPTEFDGVWQGRTDDASGRGHRPNRLHTSPTEVRRQIGWVLGALRTGSRRRQRVAVSALAEGADRIFAEVALARGGRLEVLFPCLASAEGKLDDRVMPLQ